MLKRVRLSLVSSVTALVLGLAIGFAGFGLTPGRTVQSQQNILDSEAQAYQSLYNQTNPSVVSISVRIPGGATATQGQLSPGQVNPNGDNNSYAAGTGFVYDKHGDIVTNAHVTEGTDQIQITFSDNTSMYATLVGADSDSDVAVIKASGDISKYAPLPLGDSDMLKIGDRVVAIGNPFENSGTMTQGIVSGLHRSVQGLVQNYTIPDAIQTDAAINPGNSGGPLLNAAGQVIGINEQIASQVRQSSGVSFAIPANLVKLMADALIKNGKVQHSYLGISGFSTTLETNAAMKLDANTHGTLITTIQPNSPAAKAKLKAGTTTVDVQGQNVQAGGDIITAIDGQPVVAFSDLTAYLFNKTTPGQTVTLTVLRGGAEQKIQVTLAQRPGAPTS